MYIMIFGFGAGVLLLLLLFYTTEYSGGDVCTETYAYFQHDM